MNLAFFCSESSSSAAAAAVDDDELYLTRFLISQWDASSSRPIFACIRKGLPLEFEISTGKLTNVLLSKPICKYKIIKTQIFYSSQLRVFAK